MIQTPRKHLLVLLCCTMNLCVLAQTIPSNFQVYDRIYRICKGETLSIDNPIRDITCNLIPNPNPIGPVEPARFGQTPVWSSNRMDDFSIKSPNVGSTIHFFHLKQLSITDISLVLLAQADQQDQQDLLFNIWLL